MSAKEQKTPKPKPIAKVDLIIYDNGQIAGDYFIWDEDEIGRNKKWTVDGGDFFRFLERMQPNNVPVIASAFNCQIVKAGLPEDLQGPWLTRDDQGKLSLRQGNYVVSSAPALITGKGDEIADRNEIAAAHDSGLLSPAEIAAALPGNKTAQEQAQEFADAAPTTTAPAAPPIPTR